MGNATTELIVGRLPQKPILTPRDIADAFGFSSQNPVLEAVRTRKLAAACVHGRYLVARGEAIRYIETTATNGI